VKRVVVIEGEDAAPEAVRPVVALIDRLKLPIEWVHPPVGDAGLARFGNTFPPEARAAIDASDATLFGATSGKSALALFYLRWGKQTYANVRPARWWPGCRSPLKQPEGIDLVIVRENLEDLYAGVEGDLEALRPLALESRLVPGKLADRGPGRFAIKLLTEAGCERVLRFGFELARRRKAEGRPGVVTVGTKHNVLPRSDGYFLEVARRVRDEYPDVGSTSYLADDLARRLVAVPHELDVVVLPNLYGDLFSDLAAGAVGGLGLAPSGCYGDGYAYFESAHGTAPDLAGLGTINPTATLLSAAMMLEYLGFPDEAGRLSRAVEQTYAEGRTLTPDQGGRASAAELCESVARHCAEE
jgi:isocitrate/isopropylmalate dehydrogenase